MKKFILWSLALIITMAAAIYQRHTGPTYPKELDITLNNNAYQLKLVRSLALDQKSEVQLNITDTTIKARLFFKRFNSGEEYQVADFNYRAEPKNKGFFAEVPQQPAAGKLQYYFEIIDSKGPQTYFNNSPIVIRFKGGVPLFILLPHVLFMFVAMLFSTLAGLMAVIKYPLYKKYGIMTLILFTIGGMVLGPIVQNYAFGDLWTGIPFGWDLTDNKTLIALLFWILAVIMNRKKDRPVYTVVAAFILLLVFSIPHSLFGSQLNYSTGQVTQGIFLNFF
ncbi:MAG: hypothetical protein EPN88_07695 [Bacteroidetes bacterium]|nr:MAG: hypothetical protein EPN88_07695 [Bacteroidota bacterium]